MIIVLSGKARSGKDTVACILRDMFYENKKTVRVVAYADFLKNILGDLKSLCIIGGFLV